MIRALYLRFRQHMNRQPAQETPEMRLRRACAENLAKQAQRQISAHQRAMRTRRAKG